MSWRIYELVAGELVWSGLRSNGDKRGPAIAYIHSLVRDLLDLLFKPRCLFSIRYSGTLDLLDDEGQLSLMCYQPHAWWTQFIINRVRLDCKPQVTELVCTRRANLSVRFTDKNSNHAEIGKIKENWILTVYIISQRPRSTQMDESICQGFKNSWRNWISFIFQVVATVSLKVMFQFEEFTEECTKQDCLYT